MPKAAHNALNTRLAFQAKAAEVRKFISRGTQYTRMLYCIKRSVGRETGFIFNSPATSLHTTYKTVWNYTNIKGQWLSRNSCRQTHSTCWLWAKIQQLQTILTLQIVLCTLRDQDMRAHTEHPDTGSQTPRRCPCCSCSDLTSHFLSPVHHCLWGSRYPSHFLLHQLDSVSVWKHKTPCVCLIIFKLREIWKFWLATLFRDLYARRAPHPPKTEGFSLQRCITVYIQKTHNNPKNKHTQLRSILFSASLPVSVFLRFLVLIWYLNSTCNNMFYWDNNLHLQSMA